MDKILEHYPNIREGYMSPGGLVTKGIFATDSRGNTLISRLDFTSESQPYLRAYGWEVEYWKAAMDHQSQSGKLIGASIECAMVFSFVSGTRERTYLLPLEYVLEQNDPIPTILPGFDPLYGRMQARKLIQGSFLDSNFDKLSPSLQEKLRGIGEENLKTFLEIAKRIDMTEWTSSALGISDEELKILNAKAGTSGDGFSYEEGQGYKEIQHMLSKIIEGFEGLGDAEAFELFSLRMRQKRFGYTLQSAVFKNDQTRKEFCALWLAKIQSIDHTKLNPGGDPWDLKLFNLVFKEEAGGTVTNRFKDHVIDTATDREFSSSSDDEFKAAQDVLELLVALLGGHTVQEMYAGCIFPTRGKIIFITPPWAFDTRYGISSSDKVLRVIGVDIPSFYSAPERLEYLIHRLLSRTELIARAGGKIESLITLEGAPMKSILPQMMDPSNVKDSEYDAYLRLLSYRYRDLGRKIEIEKLDSKQVEAKKGTFLSGLVRLFQDRRLSSKDISIHVNVFKRILFTSSLAKERAVQNDIYTWLAARGSYDLTIETEGIRFTLSELQNDFKYFEHDYRALLEAFKFTSVKVDKDLLHAQLGANHELVKDTITFLKECASKLGEPLLLYPLKAEKPGFRVSTKAIYYKNFIDNYRDILKTKCKLNDKQINNYGMFWKPERIFKNALIFDPANPEIFEESLPFFIQFYLMESCAFVIRTKSMASNEAGIVIDATRVIDPKDIAHPSTPNKKQLYILSGLESANADQTRMLRKIFYDKIAPHDVVGVITPKEGRNNRLIMYIMDVFKDDWIQSSYLGSLITEIRRTE